MEFIIHNNTVDIFITTPILFINFKKFCVENKDINSLIFHIESPDDSIEDALDIIEFIKNNKYNTICYLSGINFNFGILIANACDKSYINTRGSCILKNPTIVLDGKFTILMLETFVKNIKIQTLLMKEMLKLDLDKHYSAEELIQAQIVDGIKTSLICKNNNLSNMYN